MTVYPDPTSCFDDLCHAYIQAIGCTVNNTNLTAPITPTSLLLDPLTDVIHLEGLELQHDNHAWDEFAWQDSLNLTQIDRQFLLAFTPSSPYNDTSLDTSSVPIGNPEQILGNMLAGQLFSPFDESSQSARNALVNFQGSLERLYASYLWNINRLCSPFDNLQPYWESCGTYWDQLYSSADFVLDAPEGGLSIVLWRSIISLVCSVLMLLLGFGIVRLTVNRPLGAEPQGQGFFSIAQVLQRSRIPEVITEESQSTQHAKGGLLGATMTHRLR